MNINTFKKSPDLRLKDPKTKEEIYCEISILQQSEPERVAEERSQKIFDVVVRTMPFMNSCGRIFKVPSEKHTEEIISKVKEKIKIAKAEKKFQELNIEGTIIFGIAPDEDKQMLEKWAGQI